MSRLSGYHIMIISKYFNTISDYITLECVCKLFNGNMSKFHYNPIPLSKKTIKFFPSLETLHVYNKQNETFGSSLRQLLSKKQKCLINKNAEQTEHIISTDYTFYKIIVWYIVSLNEYKLITNNNTNIQFKNIQFSGDDWNHFNCDNIITIPNIVNSLKKYSFSFSDITSIKIPSSVTSFGDYCFHAVHQLKEIEIPKAVLSLGKNCFSFCTSMTKVVFPKHLLNIGNHCFSFCGKLTTIQIPENRVFLPNGMTSLGKSCFDNCFNLKEIEMPKTLINVGDFCFSQCHSLEKISFHSDLKSIGMLCFHNCSNLSSVIFNTNKLEILSQQCFYMCKKLTNINIPFGVKRLMKECFGACSSLKLITLPESVEILENDCFSGCKLITDVILPKSVSFVGNIFVYFCLIKMFNVNFVLILIFNKHDLLISQKNIIQRNKQF
ncbi:hypothetical protein EIN_508690 [Entamoeba invadens IP1]|uniref:Leucine rich repeat containing protein BspA family protein n=1 Tax=Entamoeba invadens IP1 TaxID=370355 RepID=A0A0A1UC94_ENTIV|nr:hypothetical protein EIN_508690 [Entamoeba invadens IP1]ELP92868.1 hypothetical protein EIN_508690 [Entamoeba invadens IP1]|eukprot:XP_004259639.1 hypothetical protein EIN_508690 [Entamoeba invadens IP1]